MELFTLEIISQETVLYNDTAESVTAPASEGEVTILAHHTPFFTKLNPGQITIRKGGKETALVTGNGFLDVSPNNTVTILVDSAVRVEDIDIRMAEEAKRRAEEVLSQKRSRTEMLRAEASLRRTLLELKAVRSRRRSIPGFPSE